MEDETGVKLVCAKPGSCHSKPETERQLTSIQVILNPCLLRSLKVGVIPTYTVGNNPQYGRSYPHHPGCSTKGLAVGTSLAIDTAYTHMYIHVYVHVLLILRVSTTTTMIGIASYCPLVDLYI